MFLNKRKEKKMFAVEILALCGITQMITSSYFCAPLRAHIPTKCLRFIIRNPLCMGFCMGNFAYATVALCASQMPTDSLPVATLVASTNGNAQWALVLLFGGLIGLCAVLVNQAIELMYYARVWLVQEIEARREKRILARRLFDDHKILEEPGIFNDSEE